MSFLLKKFSWPSDMKIIWSTTESVYVRTVSIGIYVTQNKGEETLYLGK